MGNGAPLEALVAAPEEASAFADALPAEEEVQYSEDDQRRVKIGGSGLSARYLAIDR